MSRASPQKPAFCLVLILCLAAGRDMAAARDDPKKVESSLTFLSHMEAVYANIDQDPVVAWLKPIFEVVDTRFVSETKPRTVVVEVTLHPEGQADVMVAARPALAEADTKAILKAAELARSPHSRVVDATFRIVTKINGGTPDTSGPLTPPLPTLGDRKLARFKPASTAEKLALLQSWARNEAIPLLAEFARRRNQPEHQATRDFGTALGVVKREGPIDVAALSEKNPVYWRALIEAPAGDPLVPAVRVALCVANGEIDHARRIANAIGPFCEDDWGSSEVLRDFRWRVQLFDEDLKTRIQKGIALNDRGNFADALKIYDAVLKDDPKSAWAHYERFQTTLTRGLKATNAVVPDWSATRKAILEADPLYESMASAESPDEVYDLLLRKEIETLFKDDGKLTRDIIRYADIALDLGQPGFAALLFWNAKRSIKPEAYGNRNLTEDTLYCLDQLGIKDLNTKFRGDHAAQFKRIDAERAKRKQQSPAIRPADETKKEPR